MWAILEFFIGLMVVLYRTLLISLVLGSLASIVSLAWYGCVRLGDCLAAHYPWLTHGVHTSNWDHAAIGGVFLVLAWFLIYLIASSIPDIRNMGKEALQSYFESKKVQ